MNLSEMTKNELYRIAVELNLKNRSKMTKMELIKALETSLSEQESYSSSENNVNVKEPAKQKITPPDYFIPDRYQIDTVVFLPVNPKKEYVYWEVSDNTVYKFKKEHDSLEISFVLKLFKTNNEQVEEIASVRVGSYGNWFFYFHVPDTVLWAEIGIMDNKGNYFTVASSRKIRMPSDKISEKIDEETWMTVGEKIDDIYRLSGVNDIEKGIPGSIHLLRETTRLLEKTVSSSEIIKREEI